MRMWGWGISRWLHSDPCYCLAGRAGLPSSPDLMSLKHDSSLILMKLRIIVSRLMGMKTGRMIPSTVMIFLDGHTSMEKWRGESYLGLSIAFQKVIIDLFHNEVVWPPTFLYLHTHTCTHQYSFCRLSKQLTTPSREPGTGPQIPQLWNWEKSTFYVDPL